MEKKLGRKEEQSCPGRRNPTCEGTEAASDRERSVEVGVPKGEEMRRRVREMKGMGNGEKGSLQVTGNH